jgi:hypothetical protein
MPGNHIERRQEPSTPFFPGFHEDRRTDAEVEKDIEKKGGKNLNDRERDFVLRKEIEEEAEGRRGGLYK